MRIKMNVVTYEITTKISPRYVNKMRFNFGAPGECVWSKIIYPRPPIVNRKLLANPSMIYWPLTRYGIKATWKFLNCLSLDLEDFFFWQVPIWIAFDILSTDLTYRSGMSMFIGGWSHAWRLNNHIINDSFNVKSKNSQYFIDFKRIQLKCYLPPVTKKYESNTNENTVIADGWWNHDGVLIFKFGTSSIEYGRPYNVSNILHPSKIINSKKMK